jgi:hypothetical protein
MKSLASLLVLASTCLALPTISAASSLFIQNEQCDKKGNDIATIFGSGGRVVAMQAYAVKNGVTAGAVCVLLNEARGRRNDRACTAWGVAVAGVVSNILDFVDYMRDDAHIEGSRSTILNPNATLLEALVATLAKKHIEYAGMESITTTDNTSRSNMPRSNTAPVLLEHVLVKDVKIGDITFNAIYANFDNGNGHVFVTPSDTDTRSLSGKLRKRHDGAGFKIPFTTRVHSGLNQSQRADLSSRLANSWAWEADHRDLGQWVGLVKLADRHQAVVYMRIIPELRGYGENYESVDICGGMAGFI